MPTLIEKHISTNGRIMAEIYQSEDSGSTRVVHFDINPDAKDLGTTSTVGQEMFAFEKEILNILKKAGVPASTIIFAVCIEHDHMASAAKDTGNMVETAQMAFMAFGLCHTFVYGGPQETRSLIKNVFARLLGKKFTEEPQNATKTTVLEKAFALQRRPVGKK